ncbi:MAG: hypothetical protein IPK25_14475 [Saprospiraceae bacterium]|nr:hypothetical protein [Saprospiraceae bacterium]
MNSGETGPVITVGVNLDRIVTVTNANGCAATASSSVTINPLPVAVITGVVMKSVPVKQPSFHSSRWRNLYLEFRRNNF